MGGNSKQNSISALLFDSGIKCKIKKVNEVATSS